MFERDLLVAFIAFCLGFVLLLSAITNLERAFEMTTPRYLSDKLGRGKARFVLGCIGTAIVCLGFYILASPFMIKSEETPDISFNSDSAHGRPIFADSH